MVSVFDGSKKVISDSYSMSLGELVWMHERQEIYFYYASLYPDDNCVTSVLTSIFLGIPQKPINIEMCEDSRWGIIDKYCSLPSVFLYIEPPYGYCELTAIDKIKFMNTKVTLNIFSTRDISRKIFHQLIHDIY